MKTLRLSTCGWIAAALLGACAGEAHYNAGVAVTTPDLVEVDPGVEVVADANEPLFFADGYYWLYRDGAWLRSENYRGGFARVDINVVPQHIRGIQRPKEYVHFNRTQRGRELARGRIENNRAPERMNMNQPEARQIDRRDLNRDEMNRDHQINRDDQLNRTEQLNRDDQLKGNEQLNREDMNREDMKGKDLDRDDMDRKDLNKDREDIKRDDTNRNDKAIPAEKTPDKVAPDKAVPEKAPKTDKRDKRDEH